jgi:hypothetical protein
MFHVLRSQITRHEAVLKGTPPAPTPPLAEAVALGATAPATPSFVSTETTPVQPLTPTETTAPLTDPEQAFVNHFSSREAKEVAQTFIQTPFDPKKPKVFANAWVNVSQYPVGDTTSYFFTALTQKIPKNTTIVVNAGEFAGKESMGLGTPKGVSMIVEGNVGNNSGAVVRGFLEVRGNAGHQFGATATGDLLLRGNAESYAGNDLQEGAVLEVLGNVGREACPHMKGGTFIPHGSVASFAESAFFPDNKGTIYYHTAENPTTLISIFDNGHFTPEGADMARAGQIPGIPPEKAMELLEKAPAQPATKLNLSIDPEKTRGNNGRAVEEK